MGDWSGGQTPEGETAQPTVGQAASGRPTLAHDPGRRAQVGEVGAHGDVL